MPENYTHDVFISYSTLDQRIVSQVVEGLKARGLEPFFDEENIGAGQYIAEGIQEGLRSCKGAVFFFSPHSEASKWVEQEVRLALQYSMNKQIKFIIPVLLQRLNDTGIYDMVLTRNALDFSEKDLNVTEVIADLCEQLGESIRRYLPEKGENVVDVPFVVLAMTNEEAKGLLSGNVRPVKEDKFAGLQAELEAKEYPINRLLSFYGTKRDDWHSPLCQMQPGEKITIKRFIEDVVERLNKSTRETRIGYTIDLQFRSEDFTHKEQQIRTKTNKELEDRCVLVVDTLSLFHPYLAEILNYSPLAHRHKNIIPIAVPPPYYRQAERIDDLLESAMREMMALSYDRFENELDMLCEFGLSHPRALKRWLFAALPEAARKFSRRSPRDENRSDFRDGRWT